MATTVKTTIIKAELQADGSALINLEFDDGVGKWQKTYIYHQTDPIDFNVFKSKITSDLRQDLKVKSQISNIIPQVGKSFNLSI